MNAHGQKEPESLILVNVLNSVAPTPFVIMIRSFLFKTKMKCAYIYICNDIIIVPVMSSHTGLLHLQAHPSQ